MRKYFCIACLLLVALTSAGKKHKLNIDRAYEIRIVRVAQEGTKLLKVWAVAGSVDKAIEQAKLDAVAACLFNGVAASENSDEILPVCLNGKADYQKHQEYFDRFFDKDEYLSFVSTVTSRYPTGQDNVKISGGHRVGVNLVVKYAALRQKLERDGIQRSLDSVF